MKVAFDTSVLVAALTRRHLDHARAAVWLNRVIAAEVVGIVSTHSLAELYSTLTGHPAWKVPPSSCVDVVRNNMSTLRIVPLEERDYWEALQRAADLGMPGGGIYDALHAQVAIKSEADSLLTLNPKHFTRLGDHIASLVRVP